MLRSQQPFRPKHRYAPQRTEKTAKKATPNHVKISWLVIPFLVLIQLSFITDQTIQVLGDNQQGDDLPTALASSKSQNVKSSDTCTFREYVPRRYYRLDEPKRTWPDFLLDSDYIFGEAPVILSTNEAEKLCIDQSEWHPPGSEYLPFNDGSNPSILRIVDNPSLDDSYAARLRSRLPSETRYLVSVCMAKSFCSWGESPLERIERKLKDTNEYILKDFESSSKSPGPEWRTVLLAVDQNFRTVAQMEVVVLLDGPYENNDKSMIDSSGNFRTERAILDDPRLFTADGRIRILYTVQSGFYQVQQPLHIDWEANNSSKLRLVATIKASEVIYPCCGRNMAYIDRKSVGDDSSPLQLLTWADPVTVVNVEDMVVQNHSFVQRRKILKAMNKRGAKVMDENRSHFHGTNGFLVYMSQTGEFLGLGHFHRPHANLKNEFARFGHHYTHAWFTVAMDGSGTYSLRRVSQEFVFPSHHHPNDAELVQFASGLEKMDNDTLVVTYGVNDCEGAVLTVSWAMIDSMLRSVAKGQQVMDVMEPLRYEDNRVEKVPVPKAKISWKSTNVTSPFYSLARADRSGESIRSMLLFHAFAYHHNLTYAGACMLPRQGAKQFRLDKFVKDRTQLLDDLGISHMLPMACPPGLNQSTVMPAGWLQSQAPAAALGLTPIQAYQDEEVHDETDLFTEDYLHHVRSLVRTPRRTNSTFTIAVHIRRGDVSPCKPDQSFRYLPNSYYLTIIDEYLEKHKKDHATTPRVLIYSQRNSFEAWKDFSDRGFELRLDTALSEAWIGMMEADVLLLSKSAFSWVPALLRDPDHGIVVYTKFWTKAMPGWHVITHGHPLLRDAKKRTEELAKTCQIE